MKYLSLRLLGCVLILLLTACVPPSGWPPLRGAEAPPATRDQDLIDLLSYYQELGGRSAESLQQERRFYRAALVADRCSTARMRLGLVLLRLPEAIKPDPDSRHLMAPCLPETGDGRSLHLLAQLIDQQLQARAQSQAQQQGASQTLEALKRDNQELRRQVDGLRAIERSLQNRRHRE